MAKTTLAIFVTVAFSVVGVAGDYFLKLASEHGRPLLTRWFYLGLALYASTAFGWVFVMKYLKLGTIGVLYSVCMILLLAATGVLVFGERLSGPEIFGLILALIALALLTRFA